MTMRVDMNRVVHGPSGPPAAHANDVTLVEYTEAVGTAALVTDLHHPVIVPETLDIYRASDDHQYVPNTSFEEVGPGSYRNLLIPGGTSVKIEYIVDNAEPGVAYTGGPTPPADIAAEDVSVADAGGYFDGADVEAVLQEIGAGLGSGGPGGLGDSYPLPLFGADGTVIVDSEGEPLVTWIATEDLL